MSASLRYVAPAGSPVSAGDLWRWAGLALTGPAAAEAFADAIRARFGTRHVHLTSTGRAGLTLLLAAMRRLAGHGRDEVVLPSYTCFSVPASVIKAGLRPRILDVSPRTLDFDPDGFAGVDFSRVLAIVATNLYGIPNDLPLLERLARHHGVFLIDDAAQAMGARVFGRWSGTRGDAGLFSLDKGKNISAIDGGIVVTNSDEIDAALRKEAQRLDASPAALSAVHVVKAIAYAILLRPAFYGIPARIPQLGLGRTVYTTDFPLSRPDRVLLGLGLTMLRHLDPFTEARRANAEALLGRAGALPVTTIEVGGGRDPVYLRLPVLAFSGDEQRRAIAALTAAGIGATGSYPDSIADIPEIQPHLAAPPVAAGGREVARRIITLPTHPFVRAADLDRMVEVLGAERSPAERRVPA